MAEEEYVTFEEATKLLKLKEEVLLDLVASNELRAYRINREMKFKKNELLDWSGNKGKGKAAAVAAEPVVPDTVMSTEAIDIIDAEEEAQVELLEIEEPKAGAIPLAEADEEEAMATVALEVDDDMEPAFSLDETEEVPSVAAVSKQTEMVGSGGDSGLGTEEIVFEDEDLTPSDNRVADVEDSTATMVVEETVDLEETDGGMHTQVIDSEDLEDEKPSKKSRSGTVSSQRHMPAAGSLRRRGIGAPVAAGFSLSGLIWTSLLGLLVLAMAYPALLLMTMIGFGETTNAPGTPASEVPAGAPVVNPMFSSAIDSFKDLWGKPVIPAQEDLVAKARKALKPAAPAPEAQPAQTAPEKPAETAPAAEGGAAQPAAQPAEPAAQPAAQPAEGQAQ